MTEISTEGYAVTVISDGTKDDRDLVAVFTSKLAALAYVQRAYTPDTKTEINHVFFGVEPF
jgi:hypothetical protein